MRISDRELEKAVDLAHETLERLKYMVDDGVLQGQIDHISRMTLDLKDAREAIREILKASERAASIIVGDKTSMIVNAISLDKLRKQVE